MSHEVDEFTTEESPEDLAQDASETSSDWRRSKIVYAYLSDRLGVDMLVELGQKKLVPIHRTTPFYYLGGMALFLVIVMFVTGALLALHYKPSTDRAFESVQSIMTDVQFGWLIRSVHA